MYSNDIRKPIVIQRYQNVYRGPLMCNVNLFMFSAMQHYSAIFEASIDGVPAAQARTRNLTFEIAGDGNLPRISILKPSIRSVSLSYYS